MINNLTNASKILTPFSSRKSTDRPSVDHFSGKRNLGSKAKNLDSKRNFVSFLSVQADRFIPMNIELVMLDFIVKSQKWLCFGIYRPPFSKQKIFY